MNTLHEHAVARFDRVVVDMAREGKVVTGGTLAGDSTSVGAQGR
ncbi:hypothetical protein [Sphingomonas sp. SUN039]|nr:hypothetical protein [Sphingomonas sp. SUN039]